MTNKRNFSKMENENESNKINSEIPSRLLRSDLSPIVELLGENNASINSNFAEADHQKQATLLGDLSILFGKRKVFQEEKD